MIKITYFVYEYEAEIFILKISRIPVQILAIVSIEEMKTSTRC
jgi:hypothetical protein